MFANHQRRSLLQGGDNSPAFSSEDAFRAAGMGISLSPADVLALKTSVVDRATEPTEVMLATLRGMTEARLRAEKRVTELEQQLVQQTATASEMARQWRLAEEQIRSMGIAARPRAVSRWKRLAMFSVPFVAAETAIILWMAWRLWAQ